MASVNVPLKVQLGCDDCYRFLLAERAKHDAEVARLRDLLRRVRVSLEDGSLDIPDVIHAVEAEITELIGP